MASVMYTLAMVWLGSLGCRWNTANSLPNCII